MPPVERPSWRGDRGGRSLDPQYLPPCPFLLSLLRGLATLAAPSPPSPCHSAQFSSVAQCCPILCDSMDCSMPGLPVHHQLPEFTQTHVCRFGDAIQSSHPLSSPSPPAFSLSQHQVFSKESALCISIALYCISIESVLHQYWPKYWSFSFSISPSNE